MKLRILNSIYFEGLLPTASHEAPRARSGSTAESLAARRWRERARPSETERTRPAANMEVAASRSVCVSSTATPSPKPTGAASGSREAREKREGVEPPKSSE